MFRVMVNAGGCAMKMKIRAVPSLMVIAVIVALAIGSIPAHAQTVTATIAVGSAPRAVAVNPRPTPRKHVEPARDSCFRGAGFGFAVLAPEPRKHATRRTGHFLSERQ